jgi:hypothetical protein
MPVPILRLILLVEPRSSQPTPTGPGVQPGLVVGQPGPGPGRTSGWFLQLLCTSQSRRGAGRRKQSVPRLMLEPPKRLLRPLPQAHPLLLAIVIEA